MKFLFKYLYIHLQSVCQYNAIENKFNIAKNLNQS